MRSASSLALALLLCACGNLSNEDIAFLAAMPHKDDLHVRVPQQAAQPACALGDASQWLAAKDTGERLNAGVDAVLALIDAIRRTSPTSRKPDLRIWSFPDGKHPGVHIEASILRLPPPQSGNPREQAWSFAIDARRGNGRYLEILYAYFVGVDARTGLGEITINFANTRALQINEPNDPTGNLVIHYDLSGDPRTVQIDLGAAGLGLSQFTYFYAGYANGSGRFDYLYPDAQGNRFALQAWFTRDGAGKADMLVRTAQGTTGTLNECWDSSACLTFIDDPLRLTPACLPSIPICIFGNRASCPIVP
jgi:hypothetical protein